KRGGRNKAISERDSNDVDEPNTSDSIVEDLQELNTATASGEQFVFISHGDYHQRFVRKLCVEMCREGGLRCYVDRKHMVKLSTTIEEDKEEELEKSRSKPPMLSRNEDMSVRIHEAKEAILKCSAFVVLISEKTLASELVKDQLAFAEDKGKKILPVVVNRMDFSLDIKYSLARSEFFHFFTKGDMMGFRQSLQHLLDALLSTLAVNFRVSTLAANFPVLAVAMAMEVTYSFVAGLQIYVKASYDFDEEEELSYAGIQDDDIDSDEEMEVEENGRVHAVQEEAPSFSRAMQQHPALGALSADGSFDTRQRGSNSSISMLELTESSDPINISFDAMLSDKTPAK
ncbi:hypothetical protein PHPALM_28831, partial [Phytophthora palmivora]